MYEKRIRRHPWFIVSISYSKNRTRKTKIGLTVYSIEMAKGYWLVGWLVGDTCIYNRSKHIRLFLQLSSGEKYNLAKFSVIYIIY